MIIANDRRLAIHVGALRPCSGYSQDTQERCSICHSFRLSTEGQCDRHGISCPTSLCSNSIWLFVALLAAAIAGLCRNLLWLSFVPCAYASAHDLLLSLDLSSCGVSRSHRLLLYEQGNNDGDRHVKPRYAHSHRLFASCLSRICWSDNTLSRSLFALLCASLSRLCYGLLHIPYIEWKTHLFYPCPCEKTQMWRETIADNQGWSIAFEEDQGVYCPYGKSSFHMVLIVKPRRVPARAGYHSITSTLYHKAALQASLGGN